MEFKLEDAGLEEMRWIWRSNGQIGPKKSDNVKLQDALSTTHAPVFFPRVIEEIVREAVEPYLVATSLLQVIQYQYGTTITFPAMGALVAADIAEGQEYPERSPSTSSGVMTATIGKSGLAVRVTEEMIRYSQFDVISMLLRQAGFALARHKEVKCFNMIRKLGQTVFDNRAPRQSQYGVTTGRDMHGAANGSVTMDNIFDAYAHIMAQGYVANTLLMHPLTWVMWVKDPVMRAFVNQNGGGSYFANWNGSPAARAPWDNATQGGRGVASGQRLVPGGTQSGLTPSGLLEYPQTLTSSPNLPSYMNVPFRIVVSPFVPYDPVNRLTDIYMFDSARLGVLVVDEPVTVEEWNDPSKDIMKIKIRERYALQMLDEGLACATFKNVKVVANEIVLPAQATIAVSSGFNAIDPVTALSL